jgi:glycosyltransferase involved in cell wall biosynthesis
VAAEFDASLLPDGNQLNYCALYRREVWDAVGGYNPNMRFGYEDWDFWIGAAERGYVARHLPEALFRYRVRADGMYANALRHDGELRKQIRLNHPASFPLADPIVSVILPVHNGEDFLQETIASVRDQTFATWECIVIDDGSTDDTANVVDALATQDRRIRFYSQTEEGLSATRNRGLSLSRGRYVQFLVAGDRLHQRKLERHVAVLDRSDQVDIVYGRATLFGAVGPQQELVDPLQPGTQDLLEPPVRSHAELMERLVAKDIITAAAPLVRNSLFDTVGRYDTTLPWFQEWELWVRCAVMGKHFEYVPSDDAMSLIRAHGLGAGTSSMSVRIAEVRLRHRLRKQLPKGLRPLNRRLLRNAARVGAVEAAFAGEPWRGFKIAMFGAFASRDLRLFLMAAPLAAMVVPGGIPVVTAVRNWRRARPRGGH